MSKWRPLQEWAWLPGTMLSMKATVMLCDFLLLLCVCQQEHIFRLEYKYHINGLEVPFGSNRSVIDDIHNMNRIPLAVAHDFTTSIT